MPRPATCLLVVFTLTSCGDQNPASTNLFVNLSPVGEDPFTGIQRLETLFGGNGRVFVLEDFEERGEFGFGPPGGDGPFRIEMQGLGEDLQRVSWGFSSPLTLSGVALKTTLFFSRVDTAVAHAGPELVDPQEGLEHAGLPISLQLPGAQLFIAYNQGFLYVVARVTGVGDPGCTTAKWQSCDALVIVVDGEGDSALTPPQVGLADDFVLALGSNQFGQLIPPAPIVIYDFHWAEDGDGYSTFAAIPLGSLRIDPAADAPMRLALELRHAGSAIASWPEGFAPDDSDPADGLPKQYLKGNLGTLFLNNRMLDARKVQGGAVSFAEGIEDFVGSGTVPLSLTSTATTDSVSVYALWDNSALLLAVQSDDAILCSQARIDGDTAGLKRDDAVELTLVRAGVQYHALFNLQGSTTYDLQWGGSNTPEIYFRIDMNGIQPDNDCQEGKGYTFKVSIPWSDLDYRDQPPDKGEVFGFNLTVHDNDRGARAITSFSPFLPEEGSTDLAELRLFEY